MTSNSVQVPCVYETGIWMINPLIAGITSKMKCQIAITESDMIIAERILKRKSYITRLVDGMLMPEVTLVTIRYICPPHHGHTTQYHGHEWMTQILFIPFSSHSWDKAISNSDLETQRSRSLGVVKGQGHTVSPVYLLPFHSISIRPTIPEIQLFRNLTLKHPRSRSWERLKVLSIQWMLFLFVSHRSDQPYLRYGQNSVRLWKNTFFFKENLLK